MPTELGVAGALPAGRTVTVIGRLHTGDLRLDDTFSVLAWLADRDHDTAKAPVVHLVSLRVVAIEAYRKPLDLLSAGMTGAVTLFGPGSEHLLAIDVAAAGGQWVLRGGAPQQ